MKLLFLSNGHGEDEIAIRIIKRLQSSPHCPGITALPLVGNGYAYIRLGIPLLDRGQKMPSGEGVEGVGEAVDRVNQVDWV